MSLSKLNLQFIQQFIADHPTYQIDLYKLNGRPYIHTTKTPILPAELIPKTITHQHNSWLIPINLHHQRLVCLRVQPRADTTIITAADCRALQQMLTTSLTYLTTAPNQQNIDLLDDFLLELLLRTNLENDHTLVERASLLHFATEVPRQLVLVDINYFKSIVKTSLNRAVVQTRLDAVQRQLRLSLATFSEYAIYLYDDKFVLFKTVSDHLEPDLYQLRATIQAELNLATQYVISMPCTDLADYQLAFQQISQLQQHFTRQNLSTPIYQLADYQLELLMSDLPTAKRTAFLHTYGSQLATLKVQQPKLVQTLMAFFKHNLDTQQTAKALHVHKNTVYYRINRLSQVLSLDLFQAYNCTLVFLQLSMLT